MSITKGNLLIVDDHQFIVQGIKSMIAGHVKVGEVTEATNGKEALEWLETHSESVQMVITDLSMPVMNGIELCKVIKQRWPSIKVMILSMHNSLVMIKEALAVEADGYMLKNAGQPEFIKGIERILNDTTYFSQDVLPVILRQAEKSGTVHPPKSLLSQRELEVLSLIAQEFTSQQIAEKLFISKQTVDTHRMHIMQKTGSKSVVGLIRYAIQFKIIE